MDGVLLVRKPDGCTSHDVVALVRRILGEKRIGHCGTLDPFASGLLVLAIGKATRLFPFLSGSDKTYEGRIRLGQATDSYDRTGTPVGPPSAELPEEEAVAAGMARFEGSFTQRAPPFSAKKLRGKPLYAYARAGTTVEAKLSEVRVRSFRLRRYDPPDVDFEAVCSSGTYIRALADDLGRGLGCGAHLAELVRTASGEFRLDEALTLDEIEERASSDRAAEAVRPLESLLPGLPAAVLTEEGAAFVRDGRSVGPDELEPFPNVSLGGTIRLFGPDGRLAALARTSDGTVWAPFLVLI